MIRSNLVTIYIIVSQRLLSFYKLLLYQMVPPSFTVCHSFDKQYRVYRSVYRG